MLEYLILNRKFESARHFEETSSSSFSEYLLSHFSKGNRQEFFNIYNLLRKQSKLEFYLRVYFFIYHIHPTILAHQSSKKVKGGIPETQVVAFKDFLDNQGAQLAKTNQFLQFYALPFIKKPLEHQAFKNLFKKQWPNTLKKKLTVFLNDEENRLKHEAGKLKSDPDYNTNQKVKEMEKINKELFEEVKQFADKCHVLEESHQIMNQGFHSHMMEAQSKWFQITKELVGCSKQLINMLISERSEFLSEKQFIKIKQRTDKYERFVNKKFEDLVSHSQDISIFDRPSINQLSWSAMPYTQKSNTPIIKDISTIMSIDEYIPTDFTALQQYFKRGGAGEKNSILNALSYRIAKSKDKSIKRLNISGIFKYDILGFKSGEISQLLASHQIMRSAVKLILLISQDNFGRKLLFISNNIHRDFISLMHSCHDKNSLEHIMGMLSVISSEKKFKSEIIELDIIEQCTQLLRKGKEDDNQSILENVATILLNTMMMAEGLNKFEKEKDIFEILKKYVKSPYKLVKTLIYGIIYSLLENKQLYSLAVSQKLAAFIQQLPQIDPTISKQRLICLKQKITQFCPKSITVTCEDEEEEDDEEDQDECLPLDIDDYAKNHEQLCQKFALKNRQAKIQYKSIKQFYEDMQKKEDIPRFYQPSNGPQIGQYNSPKNMSHQRGDQQQTPYIKQIHKNEPTRKKQIDNFVSPSEQNKNKNRDFRIKDKESNRNNVFKDRTSEDNQNIQRLKKSVSADKGVGRSIPKEDVHIYESNRIQRNRVSQFRNQDERQYRSPQQGKKLPRQQMLKQLNEQLRAGQIKRKKDLNEQPTNQKNKTEESQYESVFQAKPKIKRSPPK